MRSFTDPKARDSIVDHYSPSMNLFGYYFSTSSILYPYTRPQPVFGVVRQTNSFVFIVERHQGKHWTECLLAHDAHLWSHIGDYGRSIKIWAEMGKLVAANQDAGTQSTSFLYLRCDIAQLMFIYQGSDVRPGIHA